MDEDVNDTFHWKLFMFQMKELNVAQFHLLDEISL